MYVDDIYNEPYGFLYSLNAQNKSYDFFAFA